MKRFILLAIASLALAVGGGCTSTRDRVREGDRLVNHQTLGAADRAIGRLEALDTVVATHPTAAEALADAKGALADIKLNAQHLQTVHGSPENPTEYSKEEAEKARRKSEEEHKKRTPWEWIVGGAGALAAAAWTVLRTTVAGQAVDVLVKAGQRLREKASAGTLSADDVKATYKDVVAIAPASVQKKIEETLVRVKKKLPDELAAPAAAPPAAAEGS